MSQHVALVPGPSGASPSYGNGGTFPTSGFLNGYAPTFGNVSLASIANPASNPLTGYDTVVLVQVGDIGTYLANSTFKSRIESFVSNGGKLIIWDSEMQDVDYSQFVYPFTSNNPGAMGANGTLNIVEQNTLSNSTTTSPAYVDAAAISQGTDAVGDANVMTSFDAHWYVDITATNINNVTGPVQTYARYGSGLIIWNGLDMDVLSSSTGFDPSSTSGTVHLARVWMLDLQQVWNPDTLPGGVKVFGVAITPHAQQLAVNTAATVTAHLSSNSLPVSGSVLTFKVVSGPNLGLTKAATTDAQGNVVFTWTGKLPGTDAVLVSGSLKDNQNHTVTVSDTASVLWIGTAPGHSIGYVLAGADGGVFTYGGAGFYGSAFGVNLAAPISGIVRTPTGHGYWLAGRDGGVFAYGDAGFYGNATGVNLAAPIVGIARTSTGHGYWLVGADGGVFAYGDAGFYGNATGYRLAGSIVDVMATGTGHGYWLVGSDGGVFSFGDAVFHGSVGTPTAPVVGGSADGRSGYWLVGRDGHVYPFHVAGMGSPYGHKLSGAVTAIDTTPTGNGYTLAGADGGVFNYGDSVFAGNVFGAPLSGAIVHLAHQ